MKKDPLSTQHINGQALIEFVLILPIILLFAAMILDMGRVVFYKTSLTNAVREGARYGIVHPDDCSGINDTVRHFAFGVTPDEVTCGKVNDGKDIQVWASITFTPATPFGHMIMGSEDGMTLKSYSVMEIESNGP